MTSLRAMDVSALPRHVLDHRSPIWWGNILLLLIETTMFALLVATYFYIRVVDFQHWPPPRINQLPILEKALPDLGLPTINLALLLISFVPMFLADRGCLKRDASIVKLGLVLCIAIGLINIALRFGEFHAIHFRWNDNAYASTVWTIMGVHLAHLITATCENGLMAVWLFAKGMDPQHARDVRVGAVYWYWVIGIWALLYVMIYWGPRWL